MVYEYSLEITEKKALEIAINSDWSIDRILQIIGWYDETNSMVWEGYPERKKIVNILKQAVKERKVLDGI